MYKAPCISPGVVVAFCSSLLLPAWLLFNLSSLSPTFSLLFFVSIFHSSGHVGLVGGGLGWRMPFWQPESLGLSLTVLFHQRGNPHFLCG